MTTTTDVVVRPVTQIGGTANNPIYCYTDELHFPAWAHAFVPIQDRPIHTVSTN